MSKKYYLTTTSPYVNSDPHIGFALEIIQADVLARYHRAVGDEVFFNTGTDEHGKKIYEKALEAGKDPQAYVDEFAAKFGELKKALNLSYNSFWRSTNAEHIVAAQEMWRRVDAAGYIEKGIYRAKYCVGCEMEKQDSDLVEGKCPLHPNKEIELIEEENYFFKFSKLGGKLLSHYDKYPDFVLPAHRQKEIRNFVESELTDFSISRLAEKMPWGVGVPNDPKHVMYVWFDALTYYISALGWPSYAKATDGKPNKFEEFWGTVEKPNAVQVCGKDNLRQQTAMWQAMLIAAGLPPTRQVHVHGFINSGGQKMSKSLGNVVNPMEYSEKYGTDALRYYLLAKVAPAEDSDFTREKFEEAYQADLANGLGNLVARVGAMAEGNIFSNHKFSNSQISNDVGRGLANYQFDVAMGTIWSKIKKSDQFVSEKRVWELKDKEREEALSWLVGEIRQIAVDLLPFMPETAEKISRQFGGETIAKSAPLFPRLS
ncbi:MAG: Methionyl-tRNA synthetase [Microgenomates group bacterium GW2011_GWA2_46_7]|nr:MAG: Methionyl-tRNA synthetase [Microgenomates group bacterium GW2011_GWA2_46_7]